MKSSNLSAGVAAADITPPVGPVLQGHWSLNPSHTVLRPLEMRTIIFRGGDTSVCIVALDGIGVNAQLTARLRGLIHQSSSVPEENILIATSHTHCAPAMLPMLGLTPDPAFRDLIERHAADTAARAVASLQPVTIGLGCGSAHFNINRRPFPGTTAMAVNYAGVVDRRARVLRVDDEQGHAIALLFHYSCHPTSKGGSEGFISPDYPGFARAEIERTMGCPALFMPGCFGNIRPNLLKENGGFASATEKQLEELGRALAKGVCSAAKAIRTRQAGGVEAAQAALTLKYGAHLSEPELQQIVDDPEAHALRIPWARKMLEQLKTGQMPREERSTMQMVRVGPLQLITIPGEPVQEIGHAIERSLIAQQDIEEVWPVGYANDMVGYLCTQRHHEEGGYEPNAYPYFGHPAPFLDEEKQIVQTAEKLAGEGIRS
jgi:hypothetical protein